MYRIFTTEEFDRDFNKLDKSEQERVNKIMKQLKDNGDNVGKPLSGLNFFREKKFGGKRIYFLVYNDVFVVLNLAISDKKTQQATINRILLDLEHYQEHVCKTLKEKG